MRKILLPTDFSKISWNAISFALNLFREDKCHFVLLNTYTPIFYRSDNYMGGPLYNHDVNIDQKFSEKELENLKQKINKYYANELHTFQKVSAFNLLTDEIRDLCIKEDIELIVMGTQGATAAEQIFIGSNTVYTIRKIKTPILVIPRTAKFNQIKYVLFPTDYLSEFKEFNLKVLIELISKYASRVEVLHFKKEKELSEEQLFNKTRLQNLMIKDVIFKDTQSKKNVPEAIMNYMRSNSYDLLVMMNRKHTFLEKIFLRQNVDAIAYTTSIPFLILPEGK